MTNFEQYKEEILAIVNQNKPFAVCEGEIKECIPEICPKCKFYNSNCPVNKFKWLYEEAGPHLTKKERAFCEIVEKGYIARDENNELWVYSFEPEKISYSWKNTENCFRMKNDFFPFVRWEDKDPWSIEDLLKLEVDK